MQAVTRKKSTAKGRGRRAPGVFRRDNNVVCRYIKLARERQERDLREGHRRGLWFDEESAEHVRDFCARFLVQSKGKFKRQPLVLEDWQYNDSVAPLFGWRKLPGKMTAKDAERIPRKERAAAGIVRRFKASYEEIARKNGKSTKFSAIGLYLLTADGEGGPEVYSAATKHEQAKLLFEEARRMVMQSPELRRLVTVLAENMSVLSTFGKFEPLCADSDSLDGLNASALLIDELHAHPDAKLYDVLRTSQGAREQPFCGAITTAGTNRLGPAWREREYVRRILEGRHHDDSYFGLIYTIDEDDDWRDEHCWVKANPGLGTIRNIEDIRDLCRKAEGSPASQGSFRRYYLNEWLQAEERAIDMAYWRRCRGALDWMDLREAMVGQACMAGLDMANRYDLAAFGMAFAPRGDEPRTVFVPHFWMPEETVRERSQRDAVPYDRWVEDGAIHAIPGEVIDQELMLGDIVDHIRPFYAIDQVQYDPWNAAWMVKELEKYRFECAQCKPCFTNMNEATKQLLALVRTGRLDHGGHPVLEWMAENLVMYTDRAGNMMPDRKRSKEKIDGLVALVMALRGFLVAETKAESVYSKRGALVV